MRSKLIVLLVIGLFLWVITPSWAAVNCADGNAFAVENAVPSNPVTNSYTLAGGLSNTAGFEMVGFRAGGGALTISRSPGTDLRPPPSPPHNIPIQQEGDSFTF